MDFELTEEQKMIQETAYKFAGNEIEPIAKEHDREEKYPVDVLKKACDTGLVGVFIPETYGGPGFGFMEFALISEQLCRVDLGIGTVILTATFGSENIAMFGTRPKKTNICLCWSMARLYRPGPTLNRMRGPMWPGQQPGR